MSAEHFLILVEPTGQPAPAEPFMAVIDGHCGAPDSDDPVAYGPTPLAAALDLMEWLRDREIEHEDEAEGVAAATGVAARLSECDAEIAQLRARVAEIARLRVRFAELEHGVAASKATATYEAMNSIRAIVHALDGES